MINDNLKVKLVVLSLRMCFVVYVFPIIQVDRANRRLVTLMVNDNLKEIVMIKETTTFTVHPEFPEKTLLVVECNMNFLSSSWVIGKVNIVKNRFQN